MKAVVAVCLTFSVLVMLAAPASARRPMAQQGVGQIRAVDHASQTVTWRAIDPSREIKLQWSGLTRFFLHGKEASASDLQPGQEARFSFRTPLFGPPTMTRVVIVDSPKSKRVPAR